MEIEFQGLYTRDDIFKGVKLANQPTRRQATIRIGLSFLVITLFVILAIGTAVDQPESSFEIVRSIRHFIMLPVLLYFLLLPYISSYSAAVTLWKHPLMRHPQNGSVTSQGITLISTIRGQTETTWEKFAKKKMTDGLIVLVSDDGVLSLLPRHFFKTETDWSTARKLVDYKVREVK